MSDVQQRLTEIRQRKARLVDATGDQRPLLLSQLAMDAIDLLDLVERLVDALPDADDTRAAIESVKGDWMVDAAGCRKLVTSAEIRDVPVPDWLRQRASGAG